MKRNQFALLVGVLTLGLLVNATPVQAGSGKTEKVSLTKEEKKAQKEAEKARKEEEKKEKEALAKAKKEQEKLAKAQKEQEKKAKKEQEKLAKAQKKDEKKNSPSGSAGGTLNIGGVVINGSGSLTLDAGAAYHGVYDVGGGTLNIGGVVTGVIDLSGVQSGTELILLQSGTFALPSGTYVLQPGTYRIESGSLIFPSESSSDSFPDEELP